MPLTQIECEALLEAMSPNEEARFLAHLGHWLTVVARGAYEFQAPGVKDPIALRELNEIHHRIYAQIRTLLVRGERNIDSESMASWLTAEERSPELRAGCIWAFEQALEYVRAGA
jgi:hypothetical protein